MRRFIRSFVYAANGIRLAVKEERNFRFHIVAAIYVYIFSLFYDFTKMEYALITVLVAGVMALELVNSAFERAVSEPSPKRYVTAGAVKDIAAGAVLVFSAGAAVCVVFLFWRVDIFRNIASFFRGHIFLLVVLLLSFIVAFWFIFYSEKIWTKKDGSPS